MGLGAGQEEGGKACDPIMGSLSQAAGGSGGGGTAKPQLLERKSQDLLSHNVWKSVCMYVMMMIKWYMVSAKIVSMVAD